MTRYIGITSGKGGVGKTTTAINLGKALSHFECDATVVDANLSNPNVSLQLGSPIVPITLHDSLKGLQPIRKAAYTHASGLRVIPASIAFDDAHAANPQRLRQVLPELYGTSDVVVVDMAAGIGTETAAAMRAMDELIVVTSPSTSSVADALKSIHLANKLRIPVRGAVVTRHRGDKYDMPLKDIEKTLGCSIIGVINEDEAVRKSHSLQHPVVSSHPSSVAAIDYKRLAATMLGKEFKEEINAPLEKKSLYHKILKSMGLM